LCLVLDRQMREKGVDLGFRRVASLQPTNRAGLSPLGQAFIFFHRLREGRASRRCSSSLGRRGAGATAGGPFSATPAAAVAGTRILRPAPSTPLVALGERRFAGSHREANSTFVDHKAIVDSAMRAHVSRPDFVWASAIGRSNHRVGSSKPLRRVGLALSSANGRCGMTRRPRPAGGRHVCSWR
jgi:hypothetical protein